LYITLFLLSKQLPKLGGFSIFPSLALEAFVSPPLCVLKKGTQ
jgi:hypothetical protein